LANQIKEHWKDNKTKKTKVRNINLGYCFKFTYLFCKKNNNNRHSYKIYDILNSYINNRIDIICYLEYLDYFDKFKYFCFNESQQISFEFFKKPNIYTNNDLEKLKKKPLNYCTRNKEKIVSYYTNLFENEGQTKTDEIIFENLSYDIKENILKKLNTKKRFMD